MIRNLLRLLPAFLVDLDWFPRLSLQREKLSEPRPLLPGWNRVHLFVGGFADAPAAFAYVFGDRADNSDDAPSQMTIDLPGAYLDEIYVSMGQGEDIAALLGAYFDEEEVLDRTLEIGGRNTLVLLEEAAFGGQPYALHDTPKLTYLGAYEVEETDP